ncbi:unnamed protein product [Discula destructiva]
MDQSTRSSRLPTPRFGVLRRRPAISSPIGPVIKNGLPLGFGQGEQGLSKGRVSVSQAQQNVRELADVRRLQKPRSALARLSSNVALSPRPVIKEGQKKAGHRPLTPVVKQVEEPDLQWPLPKSSTLNHVFSGLSQSFSRSSLMPSRRTTNNSSSASLSGVSDLGITTTVTAVNVAPSTRLPVSRSSRWSLSSHKSQVEVSLSNDPYFIYESQPSAYWSGRFMSLHDKFQSEALTPNNLQSLILAHSQRNKDMDNQRSRQSQPLDVGYSRCNTRLPPSATSAAILQQTSGNMADAIAHAEAALLLDDDERCKRVFVHLEAFCATDEARISLRTWQQEYARKMGRKTLLPKGGMMQDRQNGSYFSRIMGGKKISKRATII